MKVAWRWGTRVAGWVAVEKRLLPIVFIWLAIVVATKQLPWFGWNSQESRPFLPVPYHLICWLLFSPVLVVCLLVLIDAWARKVVKQLGQMACWLLLALLPMFVWIDGRFLAGGVMQLWFLAIFALGVMRFLVIRARPEASTEEMVG